MPKSARVKRYQFGSVLFAEMFKEGTTIEGVRVKEGWPDDAKIVGVYADKDTYSFSVVVNSKKFDKVKEGQNIPEGQIVFERIDGSSN